MKLLSKSDIDKQKGLERQREIQEGLKIARRVDTLREVAAAEEASLEKFRRETIAKINEEISHNSSVKEGLVREVKDLEHRKKQALEPIIERETAILSKENALKAREDDLKQREYVLDQHFKVLDEERVKSEKLSETTRYAHLDAEKRLHDAAIMNDESKRLQEKVRAIVKASQEKHDLLVEKELEHERQVKEKERVLEEKEKQLEKQEKDYQERLTRLKDREETLARNIKRYG